MLQRTVVVINSTGRQSASFIRVASAIGWRVRGHMHNDAGLVAKEIKALPNVTIFVGKLEDAAFVKRLFDGGPQLAFINTTHWGDEVAIGRSLADAAKRVGVHHYIYSSMPDHSTFGRGWRALPFWSPKFAVENYVRQIGLPATFIYTGIYHNNFTSLPYPLFRMQLQSDGSFVWESPFDPNESLPWLDAEHDVGPAVLQIFKQGMSKWGGHRVCLAFSCLTPLEVCAAFERGLNRRVAYKRGPIRISTSVPTGYREHLEILEDVLVRKRAPYFGPELDPESSEALELWEGCRDMEEYAREVFPVEEAANGLTWMDDDADEEGEELSARTPKKNVDLNFFAGSC